eukprot:Clim_evm126s134 gene=Clim_evmTU126s134
MKDVIFSRNFQMVLGLVLVMFIIMCTLPLTLRENKNTCLEVLSTADTKMTTAPWRLHMKCCSDSTECSTICTNESAEKAYTLKDASAKPFGKKCSGESVKIVLIGDSNMRRTYDRLKWDVDNFNGMSPFFPPACAPFEKNSPEQLECKEHTNFTTTFGEFFGPGHEVTYLWKSTVSSASFDIVSPADRDAEIREYLREEYAKNANIWVFFSFFLHDLLRNHDVSGPYLRQELNATSASAVEFSNSVLEEGYEVASFLSEIIPPERIVWVTPMPKLRKDKAGGAWLMAELSVMARIFSKMLVGLRINVLDAHDYFSAFAIDHLYDGTHLDFEYYSVLTKKFLRIACHGPLNLES